MLQPVRFERRLRRRSTDATVRTLSEILGQYLHELTGAWPMMVGLLLAPLLLGPTYAALRRRRRWMERPRWAPWLEALLLVTALAAFLWIALARASLVDDAFISCRYAQNLIEGHGLVFNVGERVEGYTNFLWTIGIALLAWTGLVEAPLAAVLMSLISMTANVAVVFFIARRLAARHRPLVYLPLATALMAVQSSVTEFGTTGLETGGASLFVNLGVYFLVRLETRRDAGAAGLMLILATFQRPDHAIFFCCGGLVVLVSVARPLWAARRAGVRALLREGGDRLIAFSAPFLLYAVYLLWKLTYYGSILPNTYYAKNAGSTYFSQGRFYLATFYLGSHFWILVPLVLVWLLVRSDAVATRLKVFVGTSLVLMNLYIAKVGGDFMYGRFFVVLIPLVLIAVEDLVYTLRRRGADMLSPGRCRAAFVVAGLLLCTAQGVRVVGPGLWRWGIANEREFYPLTSFFPVVVAHHNYRLGHLFHETFVERGIEPVVTTTGIGMLGYYSRLEVIDEVGLTDAFVARMELKRRGRVGHERRAPLSYLRKRRVAFGRERFPPRRFRKLARLDFPAMRSSRQWFIVTYYRDLMREIAEKCPEVRFTDFEAYLDRYIARIRSKDAEQVRADLRFFDGYYFDHNDDPRRRRRLVEYIASRRREERHKRRRPARGRPRLE